jgi:hypothetical protein
VVILEALKEVLTMWNNTQNYELADDVWHVTSLYDNTRSKVENLKPDQGTCSKYKGSFTDIMCNTAIKGRTEFTPRAFPDHASIRSLMPPSQANEINNPPPVVYNPPDIFNPNLHPPAHTIDVLNIVEAGVDFRANLLPDYSHYLKKPKFEKAPTVPVGKGHYLNTYAGFCDGSVDSFCRRGAAETCLLYAHNDGRNGIMMNSVSGWVVLNLPDLKVSQ